MDRLAVDAADQTGHRATRRVGRRDRVREGNTVDQPGNVTHQGGEGVRSERVGTENEDVRSICGSHRSPLPRGEVSVYLPNDRQYERSFDSHYGYGEHRKSSMARQSSISDPRYGPSAGGRSGSRSGLQDQEKQANRL
ncbi:hypothetical protein BRC86_08475 [Halobacteriales archaeon QS_3_64_16]|nr:MAG: hypothetical protein BRC86_08475 [Halobacteriales archaeon QS_3_64_16]